MVEAHPCPEVARSDSQQQLDFEELSRFIDEIGLSRAGQAEVTAGAPPLADTPPAISSATARR